MSGRRAPHLQRRDGIYHLRIRVPDVVRPVFGRTEVRRSLGTADYSKARSMAALCAAKVMETFEVIKSNNITQAAAQAMAQRCLAELITEAEERGGYIAETDCPDLEVLEQLCLSQERVGELKSQLGTNMFDIEVLNRSTGAALSLDTNLDAVPVVRRLDLLSGVARALLERERLYQLRLKDRLLPFRPIDPLFTEVVKGPALPVEPISTEPSGLNISEAIDRYLASPDHQWVMKTKQAKKWQLDFLAQHVDPALDIRSCTVDHVRSYRDAVRMLHRRHDKIGGPFAKRQTPNTEHRITDKTAQTIFDTAKTFFRWCRGVDGLISINPADDIRLIAQPKPKGQKSRRPFEQSEERAIFKAPIFTGCSSRDRRYAAGKHIIKDSKYWLPLLGLYTGARLGELVQLHISDVRIDCPIPHISINENNPKGVKPGDRKHVKSDAAVRLIPLHPDIMTCGFKRFVLDRARSSRGGSARLFFEVDYGSDGQASTVASKWFELLPVPWTPR